MALLSVQSFQTTVFCQRAIMDKQEILITAIICSIALIACYTIFKPKDINSESQTPVLSKEIPSKIVGIPQWKLVKGVHRPYKTTKIFNKETVPRGLTSRHNTKINVYGLIHVIKGELKVTIFKNNADIIKDKIFIVKRGECCITAPQQWHKVTPNTDDMQFYVEFWK